MTFKTQILNAVRNSIHELKESCENSKEMLDKNLVSFDDLSMTTNAPGTFSDEELTDKENLINKANIADKDNSEDLPDDLMAMVSVSVENTPVEDIKDMLDISVGSDDIAAEKGEITDILDDECCKNKLGESNYAGPLDYVPDLRINAADVLKALKNEIGTGSEGINIRDRVDANDDKCWVISQVDEELLPAELQVENVTLKLKDGVYYQDKPSKNYPLKKN